jgi:pimeloyl-ACP methyl ester carboxylesterase
MLFTASAAALGLIVFAAVAIAYAWQPPEDGYRSAYLATIESRFADTALARFHYTRTGHGPPVVLIPGGAQWIFSYRDTIPALADHFTVFAVELPGQGYTALRQRDFGFDFDAMADALGAFLDAMELPRVSLVGHSWGGSWSLYFARRHPERVGRLVLIDTPALKVTASWEFLPLGLPVIGQLAVKLMRKSDFARVFRKCFSHQDRITRQVIDENWAPLSRRQNREALWKLERQLDYRQTEESLGRVQCPTLVVWGAEDRLDQPWQAHELGRRIPGAVVEILPGCGHSAHEDCPSLANPVLVRFLGGRPTKA